MPDLFRLEIEGLDTLLAFLAILRGDQTTLRELTAKLNTSTDALAAAVDADEKVASEATKE